MKRASHARCHFSVKRVQKCIKHNCEPLVTIAHLVLIMIPIKEAFLSFWVVFTGNYQDKINRDND